MDSLDNWDYTQESGNLDDALDTKISCIKAMIVADSVDIQIK